MTSSAGGSDGSARRSIHIEMDAFYASVEQRDDPSLRGRPVAVGGSRERGVVAASYEARRFGVRSAMPSVTAKRQCPDLVFVPPRFDVYKAVSAQIHAVFAHYTTLIQPLSLDEAYLDVTAPLLDRGSATAIATEIRAAIRAETGLIASAGVSYNKFLAKLASDRRKPDGLFVITPKMGPAFVEDLPVGKFHGIGPVTAAKMNRLGIHTGLDLRAQSLDVLVGHFGKAAEYYVAGGLGFLVERLRSSTATPGGRHRLDQWPCCVQVAGRGERASRPTARQPEPPSSLWPSQVGRPALPIQRCAGRRPWRRGSLRGSWPSTWRSLSRVSRFAPAIRPCSAAAPGSE